MTHRLIYIYTCVNYLGDICKYIYTYVNYMCVCVWNIVFMTTLCLICNVLNSVMKNVGHLCVCVINDHPPVFWVMLFAMLDLRHVHHFHLSHGRNFTVKRKCVIKLVSPLSFLQGLVFWWFLKANLGYDHWKIWIISGTIQACPLDPFFVGSHSASEITVSEFANHLAGEWIAMWHF